MLLEEIIIVYLLLTCYIVIPSLHCVAVRLQQEAKNISQNGVQCWEVCL